MATDTTDIQPIQADDSQIVLYQPDETISLEVKLNHDTVWLNRQQMAELFGRDVKTIGKHINNALREELAPEARVKDYLTTATLAKSATVGAKNATTQPGSNPVVAKFATTATDGKVYQVEYYSLDVILSVGYRVKSNRGIQFRRWANTILKDYLLRGYTVSQHLVALQQQIDNRFVALEQKVEDQQQQVEFLVNIHRTDEQRLFPTGCVFDAWEHISALIRTATHSIILIDNYCDERTLHILAKRNTGVTCTIHTRYTDAFKQDLDKHNRQYPAITYTQLSQREHDRFLIIDQTVYILGDSLKDLGHSMTTVLKTTFTPEEILAKLK